MSDKINVIDNAIRNETLALNKYNNLKKFLEDLITHDNVEFIVGDLKMTVTRINFDGYDDFIRMIELYILNQLG